MEFFELTSNMRETFENDGFLVVRNALEPRTVNELLEAGDRLNLSFLREVENHYVDTRRRVLREQALLRLVGNPSTVSLIVQLLGPNIHLHSTALIYKRPEPPDTPKRRGGWHRDMHIAKDVGHARLPRIGLKVCYCLTDFPRPDTGLTLMVRKSNQLSEPLPIPKGQLDPAEGVCDTQLNAGDAVLFDNRTFHTKAPNLGKRISKVIIYGYAYRWMRPELYLDVPELPLYEGAEPIAKQLLGGYRDIDWPAEPLVNWARKHGVLPEPVPWTVEV